MWINKIWRWGGGYHTIAKKTFVATQGQPIATQGQPVMQGEYISKSMACLQ